MEQRILSAVEALYASYLKPTSNQRMFQNKSELQSKTDGIQLDDRRAIFGQTGLFGGLHDSRLPLWEQKHFNQWPHAISTLRMSNSWKQILFSTDTIDHCTRIPEEYKPTMTAEFLLTIHMNAYDFMNTASHKERENELWERSHCIKGIRTPFSWLQQQSLSFVSAMSNTINFLKRACIIIAKTPSPDVQRPFESTTSSNEWVAGSSVHRLL